MQKCFDEKDIQMLQEVISKMDPTVGCLVLWRSFIVFLIGVCLNVKMYVYIFLNILALLGS